jgi:GntR family transcriptional regulator/MocR family aminotransferase
VDALRTAIVDGRLPVGARLPATRVLATDLGVSRGVVVEAYQRLVDEGLASGRTGAGTVVTSLGSPRGRRPPAAAPPAEHDHLRVPLRLPIAPGGSVEWDLSPGVPDLAAFPRTAWLRAERAVLGRATGADLSYGDPRGATGLRQALVTWLARTRGVHTTADDVTVVSGVAQALALLAQVLAAHGINAAAVEDPGSRGARDQLAYWGLRPVPVPVDAQGVRVVALASSGLDVALLTPAHHFPTGVVLGPQRRRDLLTWAATGDRLVIEDDYDAEHRYDRAPVAALQSSAPDQVAYTGSTSKSLAPGMRLGWLIVPRRLRADLIAAKHASDLGSPVLPQLVVAHLLASGEYERHLRQVRHRQRLRRDALLAGLREHLPEARVEGVAAGLHLLITLPRLTGQVDDVLLAEQIHAAGVFVHPLSWHRQLPGPPGLVLGYAAHPPDRLHAAAHRLGRAVHATLRRHHPTTR